MALKREGNVSAGQAAIDNFTQMMINRIKELKADWKKGWIDTTYSALPQNFKGRNYSGTNSFFLQLLCGMKGYTTPVFVTFKQAQDLKCHVRKGEKSIPVVYWDFFYKDPEGKTISEKDYKELSVSDRKLCSKIPFLKAYPVFNIDQTNFREVNPEKYNLLLEKFKVPELRDEKGMYVHEGIDRMVEKQEWLCPIQADKRSDRAYYSPSKDIVVVPCKAQFNKAESVEQTYLGGQEYYSTLLHEITHSTMHPSRLNRDAKGFFGDPKYAKEELVAELSAAMMSHSIGFSSKITDNSAAYLDSWLKVLQEEPKFLVSVMADVNKASAMILSEIDKQQLALGKPAYLHSNSNNPLNVDEASKLKDISIFKNKEGDYVISASLGEHKFGIKPIDKSVADLYLKLTDAAEKNVFLSQTARKVFDQEITALSQTKQKSLKL